MFDDRQVPNAGAHDGSGGAGAQGRIRLIKGQEISAETSQTAGMARRSGVDANIGATKLWMGRVTGLPGMDSGPHHHGDAETGGYVLSGRCRIYYGAEYKEFVECLPGDFVFVPAFLPHIEVNPSSTEPVEFVTARSPKNIVINL